MVANASFESFVAEKYLAYVEYLTAGFFFQIINIRTGVWA